MRYESFGICVNFGESRDNFFIADGVKFDGRGSLMTVVGHAASSSEFRSAECLWEII